MKLVRIAAALALLALSATPVVSQESRYDRKSGRLVHEITGTLPSGAPRVEVVTDLGSVRVHATPGSGVRYRIRVTAADGDEDAAGRQIDALLLSVSRQGENLVIRGQAAGSVLPRGLSADFDLSLPAATPDLRVSTGAGDIAVAGLGGSVTLSTRGGGVVADDVGGTLRVETDGGNIEVGSVRGEARLSTAGGSVRLSSGGSAVVAQTSGGDVRIDRAAGAVRAETAGGSISIDSAGDEVSVVTNGGNIEIGRVAGRVIASTAGGSIRVASAGRGARCETGAGPIDLRSVDGPIHAVTSAGSIDADLSAAGAGFAESDLQTWMGDVTILLPESLPVTIRALVDNPLGQSIRSDFPLTISRESESTGRPIEVAEGTVAGGGSLLKVRTLAGKIWIQKVKNTTH